MATSIVFAFGDKKEKKEKAFKLGLKLVNETTIWWKQREKKEKKKKTKKKSETKFEPIL